MGERWFSFPLSQGFQSPQAALLQKARYLEDNLDAVKPHLDESFNLSDIVFSNDESVVSFDEFQRLIAKPQASIQLEGRTSSSMSSPEASLFKSARSTLNPSQLSRIIPSNQKIQKMKPERCPRYAFKTRSESDILEDGYKWRKYGRKFIKNNPNPRNYYICSYSNCDVKKRVERDAQDKAIVITTYEGKHNHESSTVVYYIENHPMFVAQHSSTLENYPPPLSHPAHSVTDLMNINTS